MTVLVHPGTGLYRSNDGTWVCPVPPQGWNGYSGEMAVPAGHESDFRAGALVRLRAANGAASAETMSSFPTDVLWRVVRVREERSEVAPTVWTCRRTAFVVPTSIPENVPAASVERVEGARVQAKRRAA